MAAGGRRRELVLSIRLRVSTRPVPLCSGSGTKSVTYGGPEAQVEQAVGFYLFIADDQATPHTATTSRPRLVQGRDGKEGSRWCIAAD
jgi:hypothetical protein